MRQITCLALLLVACGGDAEAIDGGGTRDAGRDAGPADAGAPDAGPLPDPAGEMALSWTLRVTSAQRLGGVAEGRLARTDTEVVLSVSTGGASATFADGTPEATVVGDDDQNAVTHALGWIDSAGTLTATRVVAEADPVMDEFRSLGWDVGTLPDGTVLAAGSFRAGARFGGTDPRALTFTTLRGIMDPDVVVTSSDAYLARFATDRSLEWATRASGESVFANQRFVDMAVRADGSTVVLGIFDDPITLGAGETNETRLVPSASAEHEGLIAGYAADGTLTWVRHLVGQAEPQRVEVFPDGSFAVLVRHAQALTLGTGEMNERTVPAPPMGTLSWDVVARYDADGRLVWVNPVGTDATTYPGLDALRIEGDDIVVGGTMRGEVVWPDESIAPLTLRGAEAFLARLAADGRLMWQAHVRPVRDIQLQALAPTGDGGTWVTAAVSRDGATFAPEGAEVLELPGDASLDSRLVLLRFDPAGELRAAQLLAASEVDADDLLMTPSGDLVLAGRYGANTVLEPGTSEARAFPGARSFRNVFVARYRRR